MRRDNSLTAWLRACASALAVATAALPAAAQIALPDFGDPSRATFSMADERALGEAFMREIRAQLPLNDDPEIEAYIERLGYRIASKSDRGGFDFFVVDEDAINAFAGPGGHIGINRGLVLAAESESELASVVAHEVAHVTQNHLARAFEAADRSSLPALAGLIAAIIIGTQNPQAGQAAAAAVYGTAIQRQIDFTRENEQEADRVGMQFLAAAELDPRAMPTFFERLQEAIRYSRQPPEYLSTHPVTASRIADTRSRAEQYAYRQFPDSLDFHLVQAKLRVQAASDAQAALKVFDQQLESGLYRHEAATRYGRALALTRLQRYDAARSELAELRRQHPGSIFFQTAGARLELAAGNVQQALDTYAQGLRLYPDDPVLVRGNAEALIAAGRSGDALQALERHARRNALGAEMQRLLALAYENVGRRGESSLALAEHAYQNGRLDLAIHHLEQAQQLRDLDFYIASRIDARLQELHNERSLRSRR